MSVASLSSEQLRQYIFGNTDDSDRLTLQHRAFKANFEQILTQVLTEYGLAERLENANATGQIIRIADLGCGQGLYLQDVAAYLNKLDLLKAVDLSGLDLNTQALAEAEKLAKETTDYAPHLINFYYHDLTQPLSECAGLQWDGAKYEFDFIYLNLVLEHLPQAHSHLARIYHENLRPGGVIYVRNLITKYGADGWLPNHPAQQKFGQMGMHYIASINNGIDVANETAGWLRELGAEQVKTQLDPVPVGGTTERGLLMMRDGVLIMRNMAPMLIAKGLIDQAEFDETMAIMYRELAPHLLGQMACMDNLARKPL
jgi:2-polyprenyl-3-methyl-5-hydroxy-6-metoxy-1,4-benzoquinol methylase